MSTPRFIVDGFIPVGRVGVTISLLYSRQMLIPFWLVCVGLSGDRLPPSPCHHSWWRSGDFVFFTVLSPYAFSSSWSLLPPLSPPPLLFFPLLPFPLTFSSSSSPSLLCHPSPPPPVLISLESILASHWLLQISTEMGKKAYVMGCKLLQQCSLPQLWWCGGRCTYI